MLKDIDERGGMREMDDIDYRSQFDRKWSEFILEEQRAINAEITRLRHALRDSPDPLWGSIMNTSIEGGKVNPFNGLRGEWTETPWHPVVLAILSGRQGLARQSPSAARECVG